MEPVVVFTQISAYSMHKNVAVRKIMEAMCTAYTSQTTHEANDHGRHASIVKRKRASFANNISVFR